MLLVTEAASAHLAQILQDAPENISIRFACAGQGITMHQDKKRGGDATYELEGRTILLLDAQASEVLSEKTLDLTGDNLKLRHPKNGDEPGR